MDNDRLHTRARKHTHTRVCDSGVCLGNEVVRLYIPEQNLAPAIAGGVLVHGVPRDISLCMGNISLRMGVLLCTLGHGG